jgi:small-conductance mechanosensitive channel/CRP-like cAMP-binding protein
VTLEALLKAPPAVYGVAIGVVTTLIIALVLPRGQRRLVRGPLVLFAIYGAARSLADFFPPTDVVPKALRFIAAFAWCAALVRMGLALFASRYVTRFVRPWPKIMRDVVQALLYFGITMVALRAVGVEPSSLLTTSALLTAVLGFSMQETLGNLFAGLALQSQATVMVGDWVRFADGPDGTGEVTEINWRSTHFLTNAHVQVVVPNGVLARSTVRNYSRPTSVVRHETEVTLEYAVSPEQARTVILATLRGADGVLAEPPPSVMVGAFGDAGVHYHVRYFIHDYARREPIESNVRQRLFYAFKRANMELPFPHRHIDIIGHALPKAAEAATSLAPAAERMSDIPQRLSKTAVFGQLDQAVLSRLGMSAHPMLYAPGEAIIRQGEPDTDLYLLEKGHVEVLVAGAENGAAPVRATYLEPGAIFGEAAFMSGGRRATTIVAITECQVLRIPRDELHHLLEKYPALEKGMTSLLAERMDLLSRALNTAAEAGLGEDRRSDLLLERIKQFFGT